MLPAPLDLSQRSSRVCTSNYDDNEHEHQSQKQINNGETLINKIIEKKFLEMNQKNQNYSPGSLKGIILRKSLGNKKKQEKYDTAFALK